MISFKIIGIHGITCWRWKCAEDMCSICTDKLEHSCPRCKCPGDECPPAQGTCGHSFHLHCIQLWLSQPQHQEYGGPLNNSCPMCRQPFVFLRA